MFNYLEMEAALSQLHEWYTERFSVENCADAIDKWNDEKMVFHQSLPEISRILRDYAEHPNEYVLRPMSELEMQECGMDLFPRRAILLGGMTDMVITENYTVTVSTEMWLTEEMEFANVCCFRTHLGKDVDNSPCISEYKAVMNYIKSADDLRVPYDAVKEALEAYRDESCGDKMVIYAI